MIDTLEVDLKKHIEDLLKNNDKLCDDNGVLYIQRILESIENIDKGFIKILIKDEVSKKHFFTKIDDVYILNQNKLIEFFTMNNYFENSYTSYKNKIGLIKKDSFIKKFDDVVLAFPYKDCILKGGQTKDEQKDKEDFYNEILDSDKIDRLTEPKVLTNIKRYSKDGVEINPTIKDEDNLIIKGNNLLALHSLKSKYSGKVKLIYIDPPYNTGNDSFNYNDNFNHSTWLTFMKNRLEVARGFLSDDGVIFVQCDDNEQAYLKVLMDEIFGREYIDCFVWRKSGVGRDGKMKNTTTFRKDHEYIIVGFKNNKVLSKSFEKPNWENSYPNPDNDKRGNYKAGSISKKEEASNPEHRFYYTVISPSGKSFTRQFDIAKNEFIKLNQDNRIYWGKKGDAVPAVKIFENEKRETNTSSLILYNGTSTEGKKEIENLFNNIDEFPTPKPELLIEKLIHISTQPNDIIMDFHLGSGTTCAVAHKMGRRYIGIEQMDYIEDIVVERMKKVINAEQGGISKAIDWQGGGSFIYAELKQIDNFNDTKKELKDNMQYLPIGDLEDEDYHVSKEEISINKAFYGLDNE